MSSTDSPTTAPDTDVTGRSILLDQVTKRYPGQAKPAVDGITLEIPAGKIVMLVGPSGCGKTTTLKMINRLIEPTEGRIVVGDDDVTKIDGDELRRRMGYVIQAGGLFPHMTVAANIAVVPKMLGWSKEKIAARVDELLDLVSLDPDTYRDRYPRELSGGQQQRVGVARALAADPPVLLMDEPFGAVDPITRQRLQDELIRIQAELHKTIVIVTHDFDEAVKLGDWIVVFSEGAHIVQYDSPERILAEPANEFVENFIGSGAGLKQLTLTRVREVGLADAVTCSPGEQAEAVLQRMREAGGHGHAVVVDRRQRPIGWPSRRQLERLDRIPEGIEADLPVVSEASTLNDALDTMLVSSAGAALVTGRRDAFQGVITVETVMDAITRTRAAAAEDQAYTPVGTNTNPLQAMPSSAAADLGDEPAGSADDSFDADSVPSDGRDDR
ncbi:ATP-binding cassette domain-containing protein [Curtobacterium sp. MCPF17_050]|uniref:ABC transporter ATP-binding protein n=1 Tax=unclassified Curtobacterium TaxID=257496 RepID=UPI000D86DDC9|nr:MULTISPECIES: ATP-binding cassette domain-containing protein [unclassified Curtobacterium]PYY51733.1 ABC transporter [Curtobacterium sp. MCBD17_023]PZE94724.1 ABC transporter [Curtobacterium sp. MCBD17_008]WIB15447.1 ATP-binding cassette domain-containing protein [Curtobacterium sp. MCPF17_050]